MANIHKHAKKENRLYYRRQFRGGQVLNPYWSNKKPVIIGHYIGPVKSILMKLFLFFKVGLATLKSC